MKLKNRIQLALYQQRDNDPIPCVLDENRFGKITLGCHHVDDEARVTLEVIPPIEGKCYFKYASSWSRSKTYGRHTSFVDDVSESLNAYLKDFHHERSWMSSLGFQCMGYDWYSYEGLNATKNMKDIMY